MASYRVWAPLAEGVSVKAAGEVTTMERDSKELGRLVVLDGSTCQARRGL